ncbi:MAG: pyrroline-5-carboxylate reductase [Rhodospirillaceae bacterium]
MSATLLLVGCGKMGGALLGSWLENGFAPSAVTAIEPNPETGKALSKNHGISVLETPVELHSDYRPDIIVFAVKPQVMADTLPDYRHYAEAGSVCLSIAAGKTVSFFEKHLGPNAPIVRAMPNTPAAIQQGITAVYANPNVTPEQRDLCQNSLEAVGEVVWLEDEALMDSVTAVSGSGPAYIFYLAECLAEAGIAAGLPNDLAIRLARATVSGSGAMLHQMTEDAATLRENVTSPGGTTAAALEVLMAPNGLSPLLIKAIQAAAARSKELAD